MIQKSKGILIVLSGFSGSGKGTIMKELMKKYSTPSVSPGLGDRVVAEMDSAY